MSPNLVVFVRSIISFVILLILTRILGKQQVSQLTFFDYVAGITIGSIAANMSTDLTSIGFHHFVGLITWAGMVFGIQALVIRNRWWNKVLEGEPTVVVQNGKIMESSMRKLRYPYTDLMEQLRQQSIFNISYVEFAVLEPSGQLSVLQKSQKRPLSPEDIELSTEYEGMNTEIISSGRVVEGNLGQLGLNYEWLMEKLRGLNIHEVDKVAYASLDSKGNLYVDKVQDNINTEANDPSDFQGPN